MVLVVLVQSDFWCFLVMVTGTMVSVAVSRAGCEAVVT